MYLCVCVQHYAFKCCTTCNRQLLTEAYTTEPIDFHILRYDTHIHTHTYAFTHIYINLPLLCLPSAAATYCCLLEAAARFPFLTPFGSFSCVFSLIE